jgi:hypothetical protein
VRAMADALGNTKKGTAPSYPDIEKALGPIRKVTTKTSKAPAAVRTG